jgi:hypothetical protein
MRAATLTFMVLLVGCKPASEAVPVSEPSGPRPGATVRAVTVRVQGPCDPGDAAMVLRLPKDTAGLARMPRDTTHGNPVPIPNACADTATRR